MSDSSLNLYQDHSRSWQQNKFVYPVLSRRSKGISIGVNLNPDKICNFDCIYCQVDRRSESETRFVGLDQLLVELEHMFEFVKSGDLFKEEKFQEVPAGLRRLNDVAFSGDGEPTTYKNFDELMQLAADIKAEHDLDDCKMVLITNASMFHRPVVQRGLEVLDKNNGEVWAKLDAGTQEYYELIDRSRIKFQQVLDNIAAAAQVRPLVIQSLFMNVHDEPPTPAEIAAYCDRLNEIKDAGGQIKLVQVYTIARQTTESYVTPLADAKVDEIATQVENSTGLSAEVYYGR
ncbi:Radical SAM superfamily protein [Polystyrenella longa]|uniref:Radical SAM superfamily protein n=1 Tax=Polystyrenella longa TaxID=2528007 RepID=A0A518CJM2_9PLAN|nr:radical SAM protein [Polystyrenella longa]QDU79421.1 Radical SAM superfamily protein [Polystyrenella longa]